MNPTKTSDQLFQLSKGFTRTLFAKAVDDIEGAGRPLISLML
jgi:hypothetical protein